LLRRNLRLQSQPWAQAQPSSAALPERSAKAGLTGLRAERRSAGVSPFHCGLLRVKNPADRYPLAACLERIVASPGNPQALQDTVLEHLRQHKVPVTIFLTNGVRLQGSVTGFDSYSLHLTRDGQSQLVYKHAISTVLPGEPTQMGAIRRATEC
jgi:host factor-I protein